MLSEVGVVNGYTPVIVIAYDVQFVETALPMEPRDTVADIIILPSRIKYAGGKVGGLKILTRSLSKKEILEEIPPLEELAELRNI